MSEYNYGLVVQFEKGGGKQDYSIWNDMLGRPCGPMPVERRLTAKSKGEAPKCKTCIYFECAHCCQEPMGMACEDYKRKRRKR